MPPAEALRRAQVWLRDELTLGEVVAYIEQQKARTRGSDWELYRRLEASQRRLLEEHGNNDNIRPFAHPYYWAAFTFTGV
jgi:CHAT domain-containing protein